MGYDLMTSQISPHMLVTKMTLALLEDTGWYKPDYYMAEDMWWGKNRGCEFIEFDQCPMGDPLSNLTGEFCTFTDVQDFSFGCDAYGDDIV